MPVAEAEPRTMAKKQASKTDERKTLKCSKETHFAVTRVAALRGIDVAVYVDQVLGPIAERDLKAEGRKLAGN